MPSFLRSSRPNRFTPYPRSRATSLTRNQSDCCVLVLVDMFGGTPANAVALGRCVEGQRCICGVNLPMLVVALTQREEKTIDELAEAVEAAGCESVVNLRAALERATAEDDAGLACT